ncbi:MAG: diguanylate cyclase [Peptococcaceae bacterium]|jgi:EAL and modified HD-GYP domain-containing signal transduction protein|nr:diguanylate cyclase [Peptococcaceae bacterium]
MLFNRQSDTKKQAHFAGVLEAVDADVIVVGKKDGNLLFMNAAARDRLPPDSIAKACKTGYRLAFPNLCDYCPNHATGDAQETEKFNIEDINGRTFSVSRSETEWLDHKSAIVFCLRDVHEEQTARQNLYALAYLDHLTGVPNRQKFKKDFDEAAAKIAAGRLTGAIALFDLDNFKTINDTYGHNTGDVMLQRLTEHLSGDPAFKNHLYRLGGDEFALFYTDADDRFASVPEQEKYYDTLLRGALRSYTMPNIDAACTVSMGVSFFPGHGDNSSELLRKADIALYKAKAAGRNQMIFFEEQYDAAKKFRDLYINTQPILTEGGKTYGYSLHSNERPDQPDDINLNDWDHTMRALGLDTLSLEDMQSDTRYFIPYTQQLLHQSVLKNLPKEKFIIQIQLPDTYDGAGLAQYQELHSGGYSLALSGLGEKNTLPDLLRLANYCAFARSVKGTAFQFSLIAENPGKKFIAVDVDTDTDFALAKRQGFSLYQGYFFKQPPVVTKTKEIDPLRVNYFRLLKLTSTDNYVDFKEISEVIASDVALSYKLLRLLNSAAMGLSNPISSIPMAVTYLGETNLKKWIAMLALRGVAANKPLELVRVSLIRARFGELLASHFRPQRNSSQLFLLGMLSLLHIALEKSQEDLFQEIHVAADIRESLLSKTGPYSDLLSLYHNYEYANWEEVSRFAAAHRLPGQLISDSYIAAVKWYNDLTKE